MTFILRHEENYLPGENLHADMRHLMFPSNLSQLCDRLGNGVNAEKHLVGRGVATVAVIALTHARDIAGTEILVKLRTDRHVLQFPPGEDIIPKAQRIVDQRQATLPGFDDGFQFVHVARLPSVRRRRRRTSVGRRGDDRGGRIARVARR